MLLLFSLSLLLFSKLSKDPFIPTQVVLTINQCSGCIMFLFLCEVEINIVTKSVLLQYIK